MLANKKKETEQNDGGMRLHSEPLRAASGGVDTLLLPRQKTEELRTKYLVVSISWIDTITTSSLRIVGGAVFRDS